jgi:3-phenylpropionate/cinnamic acid dioxygenase small subunit
MTVPSDQELIDFVLREARLIDQQRFDEWLDLFSEDGIYWMPLEWGQTDQRLTALQTQISELLAKRSGLAQRHGVGHRLIRS